MSLWDRRLGPDDFHDVEETEFESEEWGRAALLRALGHKEQSQ